MFNQHRILCKNNYKGDNKIILEISKDKCFQYHRNSELIVKLSKGVYLVMYNWSQNWLIFWRRYRFDFMVHFIWNQNAWQNEYIAPKAIINFCILYELFCSLELYDLNPNLGCNSRILARNICPTSLNCIDFQELFL